MRFRNTPVADYVDLIVAFARLPDRPVRESLERFFAGAIGDFVKEEEGKGGPIRPW